MFSNYFKSAWRNFFRNKSHSFINITGLSVGMTVALLIGLWAWEELSFDKNFPNYDRIAAVMQHQTINGQTGSQEALPYPIGQALRTSYGQDFKYIAMSSWTNGHILANGETKINSAGNFTEPQITEMLSLKMLQGTRAALNDYYSVILSATTAKTLFGNKDPLNQVIKIDNKFEVKVAGVYEDLPFNSSFNNVSFFAPWKLYIDNLEWREKQTNPWSNNSFQAFVQIADGANMQQVSQKIRDIKLQHASSEDAALKPAVFLHPMSKWHLYREFKNGKNVGGRIETVWLFGSIGFFVLLLACINFMNLSTARSEKRAKEVGIRKAIGSQRRQLIAQFFGESLLAVFLSFLLTLIFVELALPYFNAVADKKIQLPLQNPFFWIMSIAFCLVTGLLSGTYPALYLSSFKPAKVLKGTFQPQRFAFAPRKALVVVQFTISTVLIIATIVVLRQIQFARNRPVGYSREGLVTVRVLTEEIHKHFSVVRAQLLVSGAVAEVAESSSPTTYIDEFDSGIEWEGKDPSLLADFGAIFVSPEFGKTVGWKLKEGRDFSRQFSTDTSSIIVNESMKKFMGLQHPIGQIIRWNGKAYQLIGVVDDMVMQSPYDPTFRSVFIMDGAAQQHIDIRINPAASTHDALSRIEAVFKKYNPAQPFTYQFVDDEYAHKFADEERMGNLSGFFAALAIFISCLGLFGMASFMAERRTKEIGVRKVLGASVFTIWKLLSKDFMMLMIIALVMATPLAYYMMSQWLQRYIYRTDMPWWIFALSSAGALLITLLTVSYESIKAATADPVRSLRTDG
jgi:ABC-type antimicrobial peptide transport system permease subunit